MTIIRLLSILLQWWEQSIVNVIVNYKYDEENIMQYDINETIWLLTVTDGYSFIPVTIGNTKWSIVPDRCYSIMWLHYWPVIRPVFGRYLWRYSIIIIVSRYDIWWYDGKYLPVVYNESWRIDTVWWPWLFWYLIISGCRDTVRYLSMTIVYSAPVDDYLTGWYQPVFYSCMDANG